MSVFRFRDGAIRLPESDHFGGEQIMSDAAGAACFHCALPFGEGETLVCWSGTVDLAWHVSCARDWQLAFARDVWVAGKDPAHPLAAVKGSRR